jgi:hypothetical protein
MNLNHKNDIVGHTTQNSKVIKATAETLYQALTDPKAVETWQVPGDMTVEAISFGSSDPGFPEEMIREVTFESEDNGTKVNFLFKNIPIGIEPEDNEAGTLSSLEKLAKYVE